MESDTRETGWYEWKLLASLNQLFGEAIAQRDIQAAQYCGAVLYQAGRKFFTDSDPNGPIIGRQSAAVSDKPVALAKSAQSHDGAAMAPASLSDSSDPNTKDSGHTRMPRVQKAFKSPNAAKPMSSRERTVLEHILLAAEPPVNRDELCRVAFPDCYASEREDWVKDRLGRSWSAQGLQWGLVRMRNYLERGGAHEKDREFFDKFLLRYPGYTAASLETLGVALCKKYEMDLPRAWRDNPDILRIAEDGAGASLAHESPAHPDEVAHALTTPGPTPALVSQDECAIAVDHVATGPTQDWLKLLDAAFFHPDGPTLHGDAVARRTNITLGFVRPMLDGALDVLREYWDGQNKEGARDPEADEFIGRVRARWPGRAFDDLIAALNA